MPKLAYPKLVCHDCGNKYGKSRPRKVTWTKGRCDLCGEVGNIVEVKSFGGLNNAWKKEVK